MFFAAEPESLGLEMSGIPGFFHIFRSAASAMEVEATKDAFPPAIADLKFPTVDWKCGSENRVLQIMLYQEFTIHKNCHGLGV